MVAYRAAIRNATWIWMGMFSKELGLTIGLVFQNNNSGKNLAYFAYQ